VKNYLDHNPLPPLGGGGTRQAEGGGGHGRRDGGCVRGIGFRLFV
jgi:hypothetical protein